MKSTQKGRTPPWRLRYEYKAIHDFFVSFHYLVKSNQKLVTKEVIMAGKKGDCGTKPVNGKKGDAKPGRGRGKRASRRRGK